MTTKALALGNVDATAVYRNWPAVPYGAAMRQKSIRSEQSVIACIVFPVSRITWLLSDGEQPCCQVSWSTHSG
jgi:hypothetical protein